MMSVPMPTERAQHLFVVRIWQEIDAVAATVQWRGSVKHVLSERSHHFTHLPDLLTFIAAVTEAGGRSVMRET